MENIGARNLHMPMMIEGDAFLRVYRIGTAGLVMFCATLLIAHCGRTWLAMVASLVASVYSRIVARRWIALDRAMSHDARCILDLAGSRAVAAIAIITTGEQDAVAASASGTHGPSRVFDITRTYNELARLRLVNRDQLAKYAPAGTVKVIAQLNGPFAMGRIVICLGEGEHSYFSANPYLAPLD